MGHFLSVYFFSAVMPSFSKLLSAAVVLLGVVFVVEADKYNRNYEVKWSYEGGRYNGDIYFRGYPSDEWRRQVPGRNIPYGANTVGWMFGYSDRQEGQFYPGCGPTIRFRPGQNYRLRVHNVLDRVAPYDAASMVTTNGVAVEMSDAVSISEENGGGRNKYSTNFYLHGLHLSGEGDHNNPDHWIDPGYSRDYYYYLPNDHHSGYHTYRPYGMAAHQHIGGAFGSVIVEDFESGKGSSGRSYSGHGIDNYVQGFLSNRNIEYNLMAYYGNPLHMGNGDHNGAQFGFSRNQWYRLRINHVGPELSITQGTFYFPKEMGNRCNIHELAVDGVYYDTVPYQAYNSPCMRYSNVAGARYPYSCSFPIHGNRRLDMAIRCSGNGYFTYQYHGGQVARFDVSDVAAADVTGDVTVAGGRGNENPFHGGNQQWRPSRSSYHADLRDGQYGGKNWRLHSSIPVYAGYDGFNGRRYGDSYSLGQFPYGASDIQELVYQNTAYYPIHLSRHQVQIVQPGGCGSGYRYGQFYDTVAVADNSDCRVRVRFTDFSGRNHISSWGHEQQGIRSYYTIPRGGFETSSYYSNQYQQFDSCNGRRNDVNALICRAASSCGNSRGWDTCNNDCVLSQSSCGGNTVAAVNSADAVTPALSTSATTCDTPVYPFVIMGVALGVAVISIVVAVCVVRRNAESHSTILIEELKPSANPMTPSVTPFQGTSFEASTSRV